ncbi:MAG: hypothetical protein IT431_07240 [Phycisphaerales bacterium]|nr:hypothetical protein [Phycisphaerales bacterium]
MALAAAAIAAASCGGASQAVAPAGDPGDPGPVHVHGLGIDPADGALLIATHTGLWRLEAGKARPSRIADRYQDTMAFTVVGPGHYLGSGHPDLREARERDLPPLLGLIASTDAGESWQSVSLSGEADFHVLRVDGDRIVGFDSAGAQVMASDDRGATWNERQPPIPGSQLVDLAVDPAHAVHLLATTETALYESTDGAVSWRPVRDTTRGLLAWPTPDTLYLLDGRGTLWRSSDTERAWTIVARLSGEPAALLADGPDELYVALHDGTIVQSVDAGKTWATRMLAPDATDTNGD